jgi:hypothetical protein
VDVEAPGGGSWNVQIFFFLGGGDSGLHNKPAGCGESEAYASGPGSEEEANRVFIYPHDLSTEHSNARV